MDTVKVEICCGTACYLLGASRLMKLDEHLPQELRDRVEIELKPCLNLCNDERLDGAPYVRINGAVLSGATVDSVVDRVRTALGLTED